MCHGFGHLKLTTSCFLCQQAQKGHAEILTYSFFNSSFLFFQVCLKNQIAKSNTDNEMKRRDRDGFKNMYKNRRDNAVLQTGTS